MQIELEKEMGINESEKKYLKCTSSEFDADSGFRFQTKLISSESREKIWFTNAWIADQNYFEQVIILFVRSSCHRISFTH